METTGGMPRPGENEARSSLDEARRAEEAVRAPATPWWWFILNALLLAVLVLTQLLEDNSTVAMAGVAMSIVVLNMAASQRAGVVGTTNNRGFTAVLVLVFVVLVGSLGWYESTGAQWTVFVCAALAAGLMLIGGWLYRRNPA